MTTTTDEEAQRARTQFAGMTIAERNDAFETLRESALAFARMAAQLETYTDNDYAVHPVALRDLLLKITLDYETLTALPASRRVQ